MTVDKSNSALYEARKHYWALQKGVIQATDMSTSLTPDEGQLIADNGADNANASEYAALYKSENMGSNTLKNIAILIAVVVLLYIGYKHITKKQSTKIPVQ